MTRGWAGYCFTKANSKQYYETGEGRGDSWTMVQAGTGVVLGRGTQGWASLSHKYNETVQADYRKLDTARQQ